MHSLCRILHFKDTNKQLNYQFFTKKSCRSFQFEVNFKFLETIPKSITQEKYRTFNKKQSINSRSYLEAVH